MGNFVLWSWKMKKIDEKKLEEENLDINTNVNENNKENFQKSIENDIELENIDNILEDTEIEIDDNVTKNIKSYTFKDCNIDVSNNDENSNSENTNGTVIKDTICNESKIHKKIFSKKFIVISIIIAICILLCFSTIFALINANTNTIISGISIKGIDVSGLTKEEAITKVSSIINDKISTSFDLVHNDYKTTIIPEQFGANFDIETSVNTAFERGRNGIIFKNNFEILSSFFFKVNIVPSFSYNEETINSLISEIEANLPDKLIEPNYYVDGTNLIITNGIDGVVIQPDVLKLKIISNIQMHQCCKCKRRLCFL